MASALELNLKYDSIPLSKRMEIVGTTTMTKNAKINDDEWGDAIDFADPQTGFTPLMAASMHGNLNTVKVLISRGANMNLKHEATGKSALLLASRNGQVDVVEELLHRGCLVNITDNAGMTALMYGCRNGHFSVMVVLLKYGLGINLLDNNGWSAVHFASKNGHKDIVYYLAKAGAVLNSKEYLDGKTPLMLACQYGRRETALTLIENGGQVNAKSTKENITALMLAAKEGHKGIVSMLIHFEADVNTLDIYAWSALHYTASWARRETALILIQEGDAIVDNMGYTSDGSGGTTPLVVASKAGHIELMKVMLNKGAKIDLNDYKERKSAIMYASIAGLTPVVQCLLDYGASVNLREGMRGMTPLMFAAVGGQEDVMVLLLGKFADLNMIDCDGFTAYDHALKNNNRDAFVNSLICSSAFSKANVIPWVEMMVPKMHRSVQCSGPSVFLNSMLYDSQIGLYYGLYKRDPSMDIYLLFSLIMLWTACHNAMKCHPLDRLDLENKLFEIDDAIDKCLQSRCYSDDRYLGSAFLLDSAVIDASNQVFDVRRLAGAFVSGPLSLSIEHGITTVLIHHKMLSLSRVLMWTCLRDPGALVNGYGGSSYLLRLRYCPGAMIIFEGFSKLILFAIALFSTSSMYSVNHSSYGGISSLEACLLLFVFLHLLYEYGLIEEKRWTPSSSLIYDFQKLEEFRWEKVRHHFLQDPWKVLDGLALALLIAWALTKFFDSQSHWNAIFVSLSCIPLCLGLLRYPSLLFPQFGHFLFFLFLVLGSLWRFAVVYALSGLAFGIAFFGIFAEELNEFSSVSTTFSSLFNAMFLNFDITIFNQTSQSILGKALLIVYLVWMTVVLFNTIIGHIIVVYSQKKEISIREWSLFHARELQKQLLVYERSPMCMLAPPFNIPLILVYFAHVFMIWRARLFWNRSHIISLAGEVADKLLGVMFLIPAMILEYLTMIQKSTNSAATMSASILLIPLGLLACLSSLFAKLVTETKVEVILKSRVSDGRVRIEYGDDRNFVECIGYQDSLMITLKKLHEIYEDNNSQEKDTTKENDNEKFFLVTQRSISDLKKNTSMRMNTSIGKSIRISPSVGQWDPLNTQVISPQNQNEIAASSEKYLVVERQQEMKEDEKEENEEDDKSQACEDEPKAQDEDGKVTKTSKSVKIAPDNKISTVSSKKVSSNTEQYSFLFPPAAVGQFFHPLEKKRIFNTFLEECASSEAMDIMSMAQTKMDNFKQATSDRLTEIEKRQDLQIDMMKEILTKMKM